jgi:Flp pilus assembly protein CpaB
MKPKTMILMVVAVVCGLGASYMTSRLLAEREDRPPEPVEIPKITLLVAKKNLDMHLAIKKKPEEFFQEKQFVKEDAPKDALTPEDLPKLKDKYLKRALRKFDHITIEDLMDSFGLRTLPSGMRAMGIRVSQDTTASGFACVPGTHVDIVWTKQNGNHAESFSKVLLENVIVLAADTNSESTGQAMPANVVVVALNQEDSLKVSLAMDSGSLRLVVRNLDDKTPVSTERITLESLIKGHETKKAEASVAVGPSPDPGRGDNYTDRGRDEVPQKSEPQKSEPQKTEPQKTEPQPEVEPKPKMNFRKMTVTVRNGPDVQLHHYWLDDDDRVIGNPQEYLDSLEGPRKDGKDLKKIPTDR